MSYSRCAGPAFLPLFNPFFISFENGMRAARGTTTTAANKPGAADLCAKPKQEGVPFPSVFFFFLFFLFFGGATKEKPKSTGIYRLLLRRLGRTPRAILQGPALLDSQSITSHQTRLANIKLRDEAEEEEEGTASSGQGCERGERRVFANRFHGHAYTDRYAHTEYTGCAPCQHNMHIRAHR